jgi:hypothetical protein
MHFAWKFGVNMTKSAARYVAVQKDRHPAGQDRQLIGPKSFQIRC